MTTMMHRPSYSDLVKEAMEGTAAKLDINSELQRHYPSQEQTKQASAALKFTSDEHINKLAGALEFLAKEATETTPGPGVGPGALPVEAAQSYGPQFDTKHTGQATPRHQVPMSPPMASSGVAPDAATGLETNVDMQHDEQPVDPMHNEKTSAVHARNRAVLAKLANKAGLVQRARAGAAKAYGRGKELLTGSKIKGLKGDLRTAAQADADALQAARKKQKIIESGMGKARAAGDAGKSTLRTLTPLRDQARSAARSADKANWKATGAARDAVRSETRKVRGARATLGLAGLGATGAAGYGLTREKEAHVSNLLRLGLRKQAEDAINQASISAGTAAATGATPPPGVSASEEGVPSEPSDVNAQKSLISSNQSAIDYTKRQAKADPKKDAGHVLAEPALSSSTDPTLNNAFAHTQEAGAKIAADLTRVAAAQALLQKLAAEGQKKKMKEKDSMAGGDLSTPAGQSGFTASNM